MRRFLGALAVGMLAMTTCLAHELYLVPGTAAPDDLQVIFGHGVVPEGKIKAETLKKLEGIKLTAVQADGKKIEVTPTFAESSIAAKLPANTQAVYSEFTYGVYAKAGAKPMLVKYYPKVIVNADAMSKSLGLGLELTPVIEGNSVRFRVTRGGTPVAAAKVNVTVPGAEEPQELTTGAGGGTPSVQAKGRISASVRVTASLAGEHKGEKYDMTSETATLVFDVK